MKAEAASEPRINPFDARDTEVILRERGWLCTQTTREMGEWLRDAAAWLGGQAVSHSADLEKAREMLMKLLTLIFSYDAAQFLENQENQAIMARESAREVIRELANRLLEGGELDSQRFREIVDQLKNQFGSQGRQIFYPLRLALAGRTGEGDLDRVILLLDRAAKLPFNAPVKGTRQRMLEFCAALR
jgi:glutamyl/glutaminyl-tRNA synthetase